MALRSFLNRSASFGVIVAATACLSGQALAQTAPSTPPPSSTPSSSTPVSPSTPAPTNPEEKKPEEKKTGETTTPPTEAQGDTVTVVGEKPAVQSKIDRDVYDVSKDPDAPTSTAADIMNKVPAVNVDADGNVTLRGNSGVQVMLNGRSTPSLEGDSRATTLQSLNADNIESIEVITNPSAEFSGGGNGIINIVLKKNRSLGTSGGINARYGSAGRYSTGISGNTGGNKWSFNGTANIRKDVQKSTNTSERERINQTTGVTTYSNTQGINSSTRESKLANAGMSYSPNEFNTFGLNASYNNNESDNLSSTLTDNLDSAKVLSNSYVRVSKSENDQDNIALMANYERRTKTPGESFKVDFRHTESNRTSNSRSTNFNMFPLTFNTFERQESKNDTSSDVLGIAYVRPYDDGSRLAVGADYETRSSVSDNYRASIDPLTGVETVNASQTSNFVSDSTLSSAYVSYQRYFSPKWSALFGLRVDDTKFDLNWISQGTSTASKADFTSLSPNFTLNNKVNDKVRWRFSYSQREQRPDQNDLNPRIIYRDPQNVSSGNANLRPQSTQTYELRYDYTVQKLNYSISLNQRAFSDLIESVSYFIPNPACMGTTLVCDSVLLTTRDNVGSSTATGLSFNINYRPSSVWSFSASPNYQHTERESTNPNLVGQSSGDTYGGNGSVEYRPNNKNRYRLDFNIRGKTVEAQGTRSGTQQINFNYSRTISPKLIISLRADDITNGQKSERITNTLTGRTFSVNEPQGQVFAINLVYRLGNVRANREPGEGQGRGFGGNRGQGGQGGQGGGNYDGPGNSMSPSTGN
jgi:outer membrane receptor protein involved in Fe transport